MPRSFLSVQLPLNGNGTFLTDAELTAAVGDAVDGVRYFALATLVRVGGFERFQALSDFDVFVHRHFDVGPFELRLVVVDVAQFDDDPRVSDVIFVVIVVFALKTIQKRPWVTSQVILLNTIFLLSERSGKIISSTLYEKLKFSHGRVEVNCEQWLIPYIILRIVS